MSPIRLGIIALVIATFIISVVKFARADDPWSKSPYGDWYQSAEPTAAAKDFFKINRCCDGAETVKTDFRHNRYTDEWWFLNRETNKWERIEDFIIWEGKNPPENKPVLFRWNGKYTCFFAPETEG